VAVAMLMVQLVRCEGWEPAEIAMQLLRRNAANKALTATGLTH
jgi:hypothetical protein